MPHDTTALFFALIQCGIGKRSTLPATPCKEQWAQLYELSAKHTLAGIAFAGIQQLPQEQRPPREILIQWYAACERIKAKNSELNSKASSVSSKFKDEGFNNCILKGQGIAQLYPDPTLRTPGDIDIWLSGGHKKIISYVKQFIPDCTPTYHHVDFPIADGLDIEIHYRPSWTYNPFTNKRLQQYFSKHAGQQFSNTITTPGGTFPAPTIAFNRIYILLHIYRHLFFEGIGMRQMLDYYYVTRQPATEKEKAEHITLLKQFGLYKFARATAYAMQQMFAADDTPTLVAPDIKEGKFLLQEIMHAGNFGHHDSRYMKGNGTIAKLNNNTKRLLALIRHYPSEAIWIPYFKIWHWFWRKSHK